jgi:hypothetical protein
MTDRAQFEAMLEALINEDQETAKEIFHNIVVAKSREIYEELLSEDFEAGDTGNPYAQEAFGEEDDSEEEPADDAEDDSEEEPADDAEDDSEDDSEDELDFGDEDDSEDSDVEDRVMDLEDALEELKAEFEQLMAGEEGEEHMGGDDMGDMDSMDVMPEEGDDMMAMEPMEGDEELMLEYKNKVPSPKHGDNGQNTKSVVANPNRMGGANMMAGSREESGNGGTQGGLAKNKPVPNPDASGNINVPGGNAGKTAFKKKEPGHGAEKKSTGDNGDNKTSPISGLKSRAK